MNTDEKRLIKGVEKEACLSKLKQHAGVMQSAHLADFFVNSSGRFDDFTHHLGSLTVDFSKQKIDRQTIKLLAELAESSSLRTWIDKLFSGDSVNDTENRQAMHWALRAPADCADFIAVSAEDVAEQLRRLGVVVDKLQAGQWRGCTGEVITDVVNIGVGGSDLGPLMACRALEDSRKLCGHDVSIHFVSTIDGSQLSHLLKVLNPHRTLFVISSKSFTTVDTLYNAETVRNWLYRALGRQSSVMPCHFIGVSAQQEKMSEWGIVSDNQLLLWPWVGGRYSVWSAIGLPLALILGMKGFHEFLAGAHKMDKHFHSAPWLQNIPVLMALVGVWNTNFLGIKAHAVLPYDGRLKYLPAYLSQLEMESNGKSVDREGQFVDYETCPVVWGDVGPNAQHAFYQLLHQGTPRVTCDFIVASHRYAENVHGEEADELLRQHELSLANCLAQSRLLALGEHALDAEQARQLPMHQRYRGGQPSTTLLMDELSPEALGMLLAAYEHKVFVQAVIWNINPFDQWGVELGKTLALDTLALLQGRGEGLDVDVSTSGLVSRIKQHKTC